MKKVLGKFIKIHIRVNLPLWRKCTKPIRLLLVVAKYFWNSRLFSKCITHIIKALLYRIYQVYLVIYIDKILHNIALTEKKWVNEIHADLLQCDIGTLPVSTNQ